VLYGGLLAAGDSVRATVVLLDTKTGRAVAELERRDVALRVDRLADSLTVAVLREIGRVRRTDLARATESPTRSLAALKAYLRGEQFYRAARWDSAQAHFEQAVVADSAFALAYHRLAAVRKWRDPRAIPDSTTFALMRRPSRFTRGLAPRERLLARIDSLSAEAYFAWRAGQRDVRAYREFEAIVGRLTALFADGERRYPDAAELAFLRADARARFDPDVVPGELDDRAILALYDRAIALDSSFAPAYVTPITLAAYLDGAAAARRYTRAYLALARTEPAAQAIGHADALLDPARAPTVDVAALLDTLSPDGLCEAVTLLRHVADSSETVVRIARALDAGHGRSTGAPGPDCALARTIEGLEFRGHLRDAHRLATEQAHWLRPTVSYDLARFAMVPVDSSRAEFRRILALAPRTKITKLYGWWARDGDTAAIQTYVRQFGEAEGALRSASGSAMLRASVAAGRGYLELARGDTAGALRQLMATRDTLHECWYENRTTVVRLLVAEGRWNDAAARTERRWPGTTACSDGVDDVLWTLDRARVLDRLGRRTQAAAAYALVSDAWRTADPELQPYVRESRTALARLRGAAR
jgi:serine/threonine-protein kinase